ncbi:pteridine-dependent deoxygenase [Marilutibacter aestuarii]|uniref:chorismate transformation enzyme, FkbO/Hyg5 family n=1 Tax=Marilutibacter aestuarii TaxID=1706195 RepID=UPI001FEAEFDA|nr:pteridine-dependent deoxygenase [Lysobacter aestuarii]
MSAHPAFAEAPRLSVDYRPGPLDALLAGPDVLAVFGFGSQAPLDPDPRYLRVGTEVPAGRPDRFEVWTSPGPVARGREGDVAWASNGQLLFGAIEVDEQAIEAASGDIEGAAEHAYRRMEASIHQHGYPHLLRTWNYLADITRGEGDAERYRRFCVGRANGIRAATGDIRPGTLPAATAIGRTDGVHRLQVYWLSAREPGTPLENPRQVSAYRYPRQYGPQPPSFARAMLPPPGSEMPMFLSGTAAVVGHETRHAESTAGQLDETLANFDSLLAVARERHPGLPPHFDPRSRLKVYVREADELDEVERLLVDRLGPEVPFVVLHAAICRRDLRMEIDGVHGG